MGICLEVFSIIMAFMLFYGFPRVVKVFGNVFYRIILHIMSVGLKYLQKGSTGLANVLDMYFFQNSK